MYKEFGIEESLIEKANNAEAALKDIYSKIDKVCEYNSLKVLKAFQKNKISDVHFNQTTGYGYQDIGRDAIENVFKDIFKAEDALVRNQFISGTHALTVTLFGLLRPGDKLLSINGKPYDTLDEVIGIKENQSSLKSFGVDYEQIDLIDNDFNYEEIRKVLAKNTIDKLNNIKNNIKVVTIQRSRGYEKRDSLSIEKVEKVIKLIKEIDKELIVMVDNCYCEFVGKIEPIEVGADIAVGSLIKNLGGGIAPNGAYVVGRKDLIELVAERLTAPGLGKEVGPTLGINQKILQGIFLAPKVVASSLKTAVFTSYLLEKEGYKTSPKYNDERADIVEQIEFGNSTDLIKFCQGIQKGSPIDSFLIPEPWDMPGYDNKVIMAAGAFIQGSSIELSCDAPIKPPYVAYMQGGLTYEYGKIGALVAIQNLKNKGEL